MGFGSGSSAWTAENPPCILPFEAFLASLAVSVIYVAVLYLPFNKGWSDAPVVIRNRLLSLIAVTVLVEICLVLCGLSKFSLALPAPRHLIDGLLAVLLTSLLYAGHFILLVIDASLRRQQSEEVLALARRHPWVLLRNFAAAPIIEEVVFRRQLFVLWRCERTWVRIVAPAVLFSLAHGHKALTVGLGQCTLQLAYTLFFGFYAGAVYLQFGSSLASAIAAHCTCNILGLPLFDDIARSKYFRFLAVAYCASIAACLGILIS